MLKTPACQNSIGILPIFHMLYCDKIWVNRNSYFKNRLQLFYKLLSYETAFKTQEIYMYH